MKHHLTATGCHLPYGITQCYCHLPQKNTAHINPSQTGQYSICPPQRMKCSVDPGNWLHIEMV